MQKDISGGIDTGSLGLALSIDTPRSKYLVKFDTGIEMPVPELLFLSVTLHLEES